jgi:predicted lipid-binding transport protein (Tim44 family)
MWETTAGKLSRGSAAKRARPTGAAATAASRARSGTLLSGLGMGVLLFIRLSSGTRSGVD